ncbi:MAG TPA: TIGR01777 family protein [Fibrobacteres bacterium]|jgi:uncharacterized protein (TIGR01777 family)|nr:TIGR01777 family protein [Fibrobacterota bacterium]
MKRILITGATGFIGQALKKRLLQAGHQVYVVTRNPDAKRSLLSDVGVLGWETLRQPHQVLPEPLDAVFHLAGESLAQWPWNARTRDRLWRSRVESTHLLVEALGHMKCKPHALVSASGMGYYGDAGEKEVRIGDAPGSDFLGRLASAWEREALKAEEFGIRVVLPRFGMVLAGNGGALPRLALPFRFGLGTVMGSGEQYWGWIHQEDAVDLLIKAMETPELRGPIHAVSGPPLKQSEFARILAEVLGKPLWLRIPEIFLRSTLGEMADLFLHGQKVKNGSVAPLKFPTLEKALKNILK